MVPKSNPFEIMLQVQKSIEAQAIAYALLDLTVPRRFLGIRGQLRKNTYAVRLAGQIMEGEITADEARARLEHFNETGETPEEGEWQNQAI